MRKKIIIRLLLLVAISISLYSCVHDDLASASDPAPNEYQSKSLWKEDETYIKNVIKVYEQYADKNYFTSNFGTISWDHALTMGSFDESFLEVPVIKNGKVSFVLVVEREGNRVHFRRKEEKRSNDFFDILVFKNRNQLTGIILGGSSNTQSKGCITTEITWTWTNSDGSAGPSYTFTETKCQGPVLPCQAMEIGANCGGSTGGGGGGGIGGGNADGGYPYDSTTDTTDICTNLKMQNINGNYRRKIEALDKTEMFTKNKETGFAAAYGTIPFEQMVNNSDGNVRLPDGNKYYGYMHTHINIEGVVKIFSPYDIATFLTSCVSNASTSGNMADAYAMVITSQGNYILKYSGDGSYSIGPNQIANWQTQYEKIYEKLTENELSNPAIVEKLFAQFLNEKVNVNGLEIYKADKTTGNTSKLQYNGKDNPVIPIPCP